VLSLTKPNTSCTAGCQRRYAPRGFGFIPECRSDSFRNERSGSPESPRSVCRFRRDATFPGTNRVSMSASLILRSSNWRPRTTRAFPFGSVEMTESG
jgi:hypothetical protein